MASGIFSSDVKVKIHQIYPTPRHKLAKEFLFLPCVRAEVRTTRWVFRFIQPLILFHQFLLVSLKCMPKHPGTPEKIGNAGSYKWGIISMWNGPKQRCLGENHPGTSSSLNPSLTQFMSTDIAQDLPFLNYLSTSKLETRISWMKTEGNNCRPQDN